VDPALLDRFIGHAAGIPSPHSAAILFQLGGAIGRHGAEHSPVGNRDARYVLNVAGAWEKAEDDAANIAWVRGTWSDLKVFSTGGTYLNVLTEDDGPDRTAAALSAGMRRLAEVKRTWDPENLFRTNRNIMPA